MKLNLTREEGLANSEETKLRRWASAEFRKLEGNVDKMKKTYTRMFSGGSKTATGFRSEAGHMVRQLDDMYMNDQTGIPGMRAAYMDDLNNVSLAGQYFERSFTQYSSVKGDFSGYWDEIDMLVTAAGGLGESSSLAFQNADRLLESLEEGMLDLKQKMS